MADTFVNYSEVSELAHAALAELEEFIGNLDGKTIGTPTNDGRAFIDEGTVDANDAVRAFNVIVGELRNSVAASDLERCRAALETMLETFTSGKPYSPDEWNAVAEAAIDKARAALKSSAPEPIKAFKKEND